MAEVEEAFGISQIAVLLRSKEDRATRWHNRKSNFDWRIHKLQAEIKILQKEIQNLATIAAAEVAEEAWKKSGTAWVRSPVCKTEASSAEEEEEEARKDIERQERRIEKDMKERRLATSQEKLEEEKRLREVAEKEVNTADFADDRKIHNIKDRIWARKE